MDKQIQQEPKFAFNKAWVTLLTRTSYLPGVVLLAQSLLDNESKYPLVVLITPSFPARLLPTLQIELTLTNAYILLVQSLSPPPENKPASLIAARFEDTWTKLRVFELYKYGFSKMVFLDADMLLLRNMDELFDIELPGNDWISANHACVCNLDGDKWAPSNWTRENCAYTNLSPFSSPTPVPHSSTGGLKTHALLNSGLFIFTPFASQWDSILTFLHTSPLIHTFLFPDQDFLAEFFKDRWRSLSWKYNALKTWRYWHPDMWRDLEVRNLHYIVDKPWSKRVGIDGRAGYRGDDGVTHSWWWKDFHSWEEMRERAGLEDVLQMVRKEVAQTSDGGDGGVHGNWQA